MNKILYFVLCVLLISCKTEKKEAKPTSENSTVEVYEFNTLELLLNKKDNKTYVINFWATWCAPCVKELPYFQEIHDEYKN